MRARSGETRRAAHRPLATTPVSVPPGSHQVFPTAIPPRARHLRQVSLQEQLVAIDVHGSEDRAKDASPPVDERAVLAPRPRCMRFDRAHADVVPFLGDPWTSDVIGARAERGGDPLLTDGPTKIHVRASPREGRRHPVDRDAFHRLRPRGLSDVDDSTTTPSRRSLAHAAHTFSPGRGEVPSRALQAPRSGHPRTVTFERRAPFGPAGLPVPGTDDPSTPAWLGRCFANGD